MVLQKSIVIDLNKYGEEGYIAVGYPSLRKTVIAQQIGSARMVSFSKKGEPSIDSTKAVEADLVLNVLQYIEEAPFELMSVDAFFDFTDKLDSKRRGAGAELYKELTDTIEKVISGEASPSASSQEAETASSA